MSWLRRRLDLHGAPGTDGVPTTDQPPSGPFGAALTSSAHRGFARRLRPKLGVDLLGPRAEAVIRAWLSALDYEPPVVLAAWEHPRKAVFLLSGYVTLPYLGQVSEPGGATVTFAYEGDWENTPRGLERKVSATISGPCAPRLHPSRFAQADGALVPVGYSPAGVLHLPLLGTPISITGPEAAGMMTAMAVRAALRLGKGACRAITDQPLAPLFEATGDVQHLPAISHPDELHAWLLEEQLTREAIAAGKRADNFREHALIGRGSYLPVLLLAVDQREPAAPLPIRGAPDEGITTLVLGETDQTSRRITVSRRHATIDAGLGTSEITLRPALLTPVELEHAALLLAARSEPMPATGLRPSIERDGFVSSPLPAPPALPLRHSTPTVGDPPVRPSRPDFEAEPRPEPQGSVTSEQHPARRIYCLGRLRIERDGQPVEDRLRAPSRALIALLLTRPDGLVADTAQFTLWPKQEDPTKSGASLRQCLTDIRKHLGVTSNGTGIIQRTGDRIRLDLTNAWVDLVAFESALKQARTAADPEPYLQTAVDLYQGDFCDGAYSDWSEPTAKRLRDQLTDAAVALAGIHEHHGDLDSAVRVIDQAITANQHAEHLYRTAMQLEAQRGRRNEVVRRYRTLTKLLTDDLDVTPQAQTIELFKSLTDT